MPVSVVAGVRLRSSAGTSGRAAVRLQGTDSLGPLARMMGVGAIVVGAVAIGFNPNRRDVVILPLPRGHGIHLSDVVGAMLVSLGTAVLWRSPRRR
jgi:hypothetical protein